jgi:hypothetical protein
MMRGLFVQVVLFLEFIASFLEFSPHEATLTEGCIKAPARLPTPPHPTHTHTLNTMDWSIQKYYPEIRILF